MAQTSRPSSDVSQTGAWSSTGGSFYTEIDESVASDADYIKYDYPGVELNSVIVGLASLSDPGVHTGHTFYFRAKFDPVGPASSDPDLTVSLMEGGDVISSSTVTLGAAYVDYSKTLSEPEAANITDYTDLRLMFSVSDGASLYDYFVTQAYLEIPDVVSSGGGSFTAPFIEADSRTYDHNNVYGYGAGGEIIPQAGDQAVHSERDWRYKPTTVQGAHTSKLCALCGQWCDGDRAVFYSSDRSGSKWYCPDHVPYDTHKGPDMWRI